MSSNSHLSNLAVLEVTAMLSPLAQEEKIYKKQVLHGGQLRTGNKGGIAFFATFQVDRLRYLATKVSEFRGLFCIFCFNFHGNRSK